MLNVQQSLATSCPLSRMGFDALLSSLISCVLPSKCVKISFPVVRICELVSQQPVFCWHQQRQKPCSCIASPSQLYLISLQHRGKERHSRPGYFWPYISKICVHNWPCIKNAEWRSLACVHCRTEQRQTSWTSGPGPSSCHSIAASQVMNISYMWNKHTDSRQQRPWGQHYERQSKFNGVHHHHVADQISFLCNYLFCCLDQFTLTFERHLEVSVSVSIKREPPEVCSTAAAWTRHSALTLQGFSWEQRLFLWAAPTFSLQFFLGPCISASLH